jgi:hypothetical protein
MLWTCIAGRGIGLGESPLQKTWPRGDAAMKRLLACGMLALVCGAYGTASAADVPEGNSVFNGAQNPAFSRWGGMPPPRPKTPSPTPAAKARAADTAAATRAQEEANFLRRLAVCDKLQQMANEIGDEALEKQAMQLQQKAQSVYKQRTAVNFDAPADDAPRGKKR